jgi:hypothetical protein
MQRLPPHHVSRHQLENLCLGAGADLSKGLLDLVASLHVLLVVVVQKRMLRAETVHRTAFSNSACKRVTYLLPHLHDLESLKVIQSSPLLHRRALLSPCAVVKLLLDLVLFPLLRNVANTGGTGELGNDDGGKRELCECDLLAGDGGLLGGTINKHLYFL